jgi:hypothetical protein
MLNTKYVHGFESSIFCEERCDLKIADLQWFKIIRMFHACSTTLAQIYDFIYVD